MDCLTRVISSENTFTTRRGLAWADISLNSLTESGTMKMGWEACTCTHRGGSTTRNWIFREAITLSTVEAWTCRRTDLDLGYKVSTENFQEPMVQKRRLADMVLH